jgi:hypothetical protein
MRTDRLHPTQRRSTRRRQHFRHALYRTRAVHLLDIENLTASPRPGALEVTATMELYRTAVPIGRMDQFIAAVNPRSLVSVGIALQGVQLLTLSGPDGADRALVETALEDHLDQRFSRVVIGSGDGYFAGLAVWLIGRGVHVTVVSRRGALNWRLYTSVPDTVILDSPTVHVA